MQPMNIFDLNQGVTKQNAVQNKPVFFTKAAEKVENNFFESVINGEVDDCLVKEKIINLFNQQQML